MTEPSIIININKKTDRFFMAIAKIEIHSFIFFGVYNQFTVENLLSRVGKVFDINGKDDSCIENCGRILHICSGGFRARLMDEGIFRRGQSKAIINYQAYDIRYEQYLEYLAILSNLSTEENYFSCYLPYEETEEQISLKYSIVPSLISLNAKAEQIKASVDNLDLYNTCRHSAIKLVETIQNEPVSNSVSKYFFYDLPYKTELEYGQPNSSIPFYVLPVPPSAYVGLGEQKERILKKLYHRMERLPQIAPNAQATMDKFSRLKELYTLITGVGNDLTGTQSISLDQLLLNIQNWKRDNRDVLEPLREKYIWDFFFKRTSATMSLVNEIESELKKFLVSPSA